MGENKPIHTIAETTDAPMVLILDGTSKIVTHEGAISVI